MDREADVPSGWLLIPREAVHLGPCVAVLSAVRFFCRKGGECFASQSTLGERAGLSRHQVMRHVASLENDGYLTKQSSARDTLSLSLTEAGSLLFEDASGQTRPFFKYHPLPGMTWYQRLVLCQLWNHWQTPIDCEGTAVGDYYDLSYRSWAHLANRCGLSKHRATDVRKAACWLIENHWITGEVAETGYYHFSPTTGAVNILFRAMTPLKKVAIKEARLSREGLPKCNRGVTDQSQGVTDVQQQPNESATGCYGLVTQEENFLREIEKEISIRNSEEKSLTFSDETESQKSIQSLPHGPEGAGQTDSDDWPDDGYDEQTWARELSVLAMRAEEHKERARRRQSARSEVIGPTFGSVLRQLNHARGYLPPPQFEVLIE